MKSEVLSKGDAGYNIEEQRHEMVRGGTKAGTGQPLPQTAQQHQL